MHHPCRPADCPAPPSLPSSRLPSLPACHRLLAAALGLALGAASALALARPAAAQAPAPAPGPRWLPVLATRGEAEPCEPRVSIQNLDARPARALLVLWEEPADGEPAEGAAPCRAPLAVRCTGLLGPGGTWRFDVERPEGLLYGASHGAVLAFDAQPRDAMGDDLTDRICAAAARSLPDDCAAWSELLSVARTGGAFAGIDVPASALRSVQVTLESECAGGFPGVPAHAASAAPVDAPTARAWALPVPFPIPSAGAGGATLWLQSARDDGASSTVRVHTEAFDECGTRSPCGEPLDLPAGGRAGLDLAGCLADEWRGQVLVASDGPLAILLEARDELNETIVAQSAVAEDAGPDAGVGRGALAAPWLPSPQHGWETEALVHNHEDAPARVLARFLAADGVSLAEEEALVCPGGAGRLVLALRDDLPGSAEGTLRIEARREDGAPARVSGLALHTRFRDASRSARREALSQALTPLEAGAARLAAPWISRLSSTWEASPIAELALASLAPAPGYTEAAILILDANALVDVLCRRLEGPAPTYLDPLELGRLDNGLRGAALVSALHWSYADGGGPRLAGSQVLRSGTRRGEDVPGDETAALRLAPAPPLPPALAAPGLACRPGGGPPGPPLLTRPPVEPAAGAALVGLPLLGYQAADPICRANATSRNEGDEAAVHLLLRIADPEACDPGCTGWDQALCSGLIAPGEVWAWPEIREDAAARVYALTARSLAELGLPGEGGAAEALCSALAAEPPAARCAAQRRFQAAWDAGAAYAGLPLDALRGGAPSAHVERECPGTQGPGVVVATSYTLRPSDAALAEDDGAFRLSTPYVFADKAYMNSILYVQNLGRRCTDVGLRFRSRADCLRGRRCQMLSLAPGEARAFDANDCVGPDFIGTASLEASEPILGVVELVASRDVEGAFTRVIPLFPAREPFDLDGDGEVTDADAALVEAAEGRSEDDPDWDARLDLYPDGRIDAFDAEAVRDHYCRTELEPPVLDPPAAPPRPADRLLLPALGPDGEGGGCAPEVRVQNVADEAVSVLALAWQQQAASPPGGCAGPAVAWCSGLLAPGGSWRVDPLAALGTGDPRDAGSMSLWALRDLRASEAGLELPGDPRLADALCAALAGAPPEDCDAYGALVRAWEEGADWQGLPLDELRGRAIQAAVHRRCQADVTPDLGASAGYAAPDRSTLGPPDDEGRYRYAVPLVYADKAGFRTFLHVQNAGDARAELRLAMKAQDECGFEKDCAPLGLAPGRAATISVQGCVGPDYQGSAWLVSDQPLATVVDIVGRDARMSYPAVPTRRDTDARGAQVLAGSSVLFGAWNPRPEEGWDTGVQVMNLDPSRAARVRASFVDGSGVIRDFLDDVICPGGTQTFFVPVLGAAPGREGGTIVVESLRRPFDADEPPPALAGLSIAIRYRDPARSEVLAASFSPLQPAGLGFRWPEGGGAAGLQAGVGVVALPLAAEDAAASAVVLGNLVRVPGQTEVLLRAMDAEGATLNERCLTLDAGRGARVALNEMALDPSLVGALLVSATSWSHRAPDGRPLVGLSAVVLEGPDGAAEAVAGDGLAQIPGAALLGAPAWVASPAAPCPPLAVPTPWPSVTPRPTASPTPTGPPPTATPSSAPIYLPRADR